LDKGGRITLARSFHVEALRGGMNRLLLRALRNAEHPSRVEVLFQYVQDLDIPMTFDRLEIADVTEDERVSAASLLQRFPECRVYRLNSGLDRSGRVVAAACVVGEDNASAAAESMFPMMS
jgi:hypothetical protein